MKSTKYAKKLTSVDPE